MKVEIPEDILRSAALTEEECLAGLAVGLYADRRVTIAQALRLCGLDRAAFERELARRNITLYSLDDLRDDVETLRGLGRL